MKSKHKLLLAAAVVGLPAVVLAATVQFQNFSDSGAVIQVSGQMPGTIARLERSTDLTTWTPVAAQTVAPDGTAFLVHALTPGDPRGFYRVAAEPAPRLHSVVQLLCAEDNQPRVLTAAVEFPVDNSVPQSNEGAAYPQVDVTVVPLKAGNKLMVEAELSAVLGAGNGNGVYAALFVNNEADALAVVSETQSSNLPVQRTVKLRHFVTAADTAPKTFHIRVSGNGGVPVMVNSVYSGHTLGQKFASTMTVTEIQQ